MLAQLNGLLTIQWTRNGFSHSPNSNVNIFSEFLKCSTQNPGFNWPFDSDITRISKNGGSFWHENVRKSSQKSCEIVSITINLMISEIWFFKYQISLLVRYMFYNSVWFLLQDFVTLVYGHFRWFYNARYKFMALI